jgi:WD40 repeat protein
MGMPRPERPLDAEAGPLADFAADLRRLRERAGSPGYRELARRAHYSVTTLSDAAGGKRMPSLAVTLAYVRACGAPDAEWEARWREVAGELAATQPGAAVAEPPYVGLRPFQADDAGRFFGRERLVGELIDRVTRQRFVGVFGASGAGKSSLLRAGLVPRIQEEGLKGEPWQTVVMTPGAHPLEELRARLSDVTPGFVLVVDQFEEVFTLCQDRRERAAFLAELTALGDRARVVVGVRADFYGQCSQSPELVEALSDAQVLVGPMTAEELRLAVTRPAGDAGCTIEGALLATIIDDAAGQPGALPLISHALLETWHRRRGAVLTLAAYQETGGIRGALAQTAERVYDSFSADQQRVAKDLFLRLTSPGDEGNEHTRRRIDRRELATGDPDTETVLATLAEVRLITLAESTVDLAHEALIRAWPRLHRWLADDRDGLRVHRDLTEAALAWESLDRDSGALYRGARLATAREWDAERRRTDLTSSERAFLDAAVQLQDAERAAAARRVRRFRVLVACLVILLMTTSVAGVTAWRQREKTEAAHRVAVSRQLAVQALAMADAEPVTAQLLAVRAFRLAPTTEARGALLSMSARQSYQAELTGHDDAVSDLAHSQDGRTIASVSRDRALMLWDTGSRTRTAVITGHDTWLRAVALSPDGRLAVTGGDDHRAVVWDVATRTKITTLTGHTGSIKTVMFSPDGRLLATAGDDGTVLVRETGRWTGVTTLTGPGGPLRAVAFSPDSRTLAAAGKAGTIVLFDLPGGTVKASLTGHPDTVADVAFSPDGRTLASAGYRGAVALWSTTDGTLLARLTEHTGDVHAVEFSPDGDTVITAGSDHVVVLWDTAQRTVRARLTGLTHNVYALAVDPRTGALATAGEDRTIVLWNPSRPSLALTGEPDSVTDLAFSPDGQVLATASDGRTTLWDVRRRMRLGDIPSGRADTVAFSPDGTVLATSNVDSPDVLFWDVRQRTHLATLTGRHREAVLDVAFSPDGRVVATAGVDQTVELWDAGSRTHLATLPGHGSTVNGLAFSPDGTLLATAAHDNNVRLWDVAARTPVATLTGHRSWARTVAFSPDGRTLASAAIDQTVALWDVRERSRTAVVTGHADAAVGVAFHPGGHTVALTGDDHSVVLWDPAGSPRARLHGHTAAPGAVAFSPDGATAASIGADRVVMLWDTDPEAVATRLCESLARDLTSDEWQRYAPDIDRQPACP